MKHKVLGTKHTMLEAKRSSIQPHMGSICIGFSKIWGSQICCTYFRGVITSNENCTGDLSGKIFYKVGQNFQKACPSSLLMPHEAQCKPAEDQKEYDKQCFVANIRPHVHVVQAEVLQDWFAAIHDILPLEVIYHEGRPGILQPVYIWKPARNSCLKATSCRSLHIWWSREITAFLYRSATADYSY